jgi:hypothetical protein
MTVLRYAFWGFIVILLLPTSDDEKHAIYGGLKKVGWDFVTFCDRNPDVCQGVKDAVGSVVQKLNLGAEMVSDAMEHGDGLQADVEGPGAGAPMAVDKGGSGVDLPPLRPAPRVKPAVYESQSTLTEEDLRPHWQGPRT